MRIINSFDQNFRYLEPIDSPAGELRLWIMGNLENKAERVDQIDGKDGLFLAFFPGMLVKPRPGAWAWQVSDVIEAGSRPEFPEAPHEEFSILLSILFAEFR